MGIPKFYRWISERYPCLSEKIREYQIPEFDNLYLDMNGIIHNCSHPNDEDVHLRIPEKNIFHDIFRYIDFILKMIKPRKAFFMAIDGVAPRAKMNQQRGRRFRSAKLAEDQEAEAVRKGEVLPSEERFDSNCITPGTEFMARLHLQLQYFIKVKVSTDPLWQRKGLTIYLSGHDVPGEGEHKIMDFIRHIRSQPDYDPETRHCLYGLDADLIMLGLSTHELRFSLLREEVKFTRGKKARKPSASVTRFKQLATYDFTNVSIFNTETDGAVAVSEELSSGAQVPSDPHKFLLSGAKSFAEMAKLEPKPLEVKVNNVNMNYEVELMPPSSHDEFAKGTYKPPMPEKTTFLLLHLSLLRDYIDEEFQGLKLALENHPTVKYDLEKLIDDWILLSILVGNDFVPHLPKLHIVKGAFPMLYQTYAELLPTLDGYMNENGVLNLSRFEKFLTKLSKFDLEVFRETYDDMKYMESKTGKNIVLGEKMFENFGFDEDEFDETELEPQDELKAFINRTNDEVFGSTENKENAPICQDAFDAPDDFFEDDDSPELRLEFFQYKRNYYMEKIGISDVTRDVIQSQAVEYVRALQWILYYYYKGVSSWGWFYPGHYAPFASDIRNFSTYKIRFDLGKPFKPFEQLLGVLPAQSKKLLPECFQWLMTNTESPILEFYPKEFENDLNGKKQDWEAVVLIPFIEENRLLFAMEEVARLTAEESHRNSKGVMHGFTHSKPDTGPVTSASDLFPAFASSHYEEVHIEEVKYNPDILPKGIHPGAKKDKIYQGFPSLKSIPHTSSLERAEVKVFEFATREDSMLIDIPLEETRTQQLAKELIGKTVWVNWPHLTFALVTGISDEYQKFLKQFDSKDAKIIKDPNYKPQVHKAMSKNLTEKHLKFKGIRLSEVNVIIWATPMEGRKLVCNAKGQVVGETQWSRFEQAYALQTTIHTSDVTEIFYLDRIQHKSYQDMFSVGDKVFKLENPYYGEIGIVTGLGGGEVLVEFETGSHLKEENIAEALGGGALKSRDYYSAHDASKRLSIPPYTLARLTGTFFVVLERKAGSSKKNGRRPNRHSKNAKNGPGVQLPDSTPSDDDTSSSEEFNMNRKPKTENIGLSLKFNKRNLEVRGYTRKVDGSWMYSMKAVNLVQDYCRAFPAVLQFLQYGGGSVGSRDSYNASEIYPENPNESVKGILDWIDSKGVKELPRVPMNSNILDDDDVHDVWTHVLSSKVRSNNTQATKEVLSLKPNTLYKPGLNRGCVPASSVKNFNLLDRVICVDPGAPVPLGQRGTIIGVQNPPDQAQQEEEAFRSTSSTSLRTLVILSDPIQDVFDSTSSNDTADMTANTLSKEEVSSSMSNALLSMLRISQNGPTSSPLPALSLAATSNGTGNGPVKRGKPTLIMLYPFQVLNLSDNDRKVSNSESIRANQEWSRKEQEQYDYQQQRDWRQPQSTWNQPKPNQPTQFTKRKERIEIQKPSSYRPTESTPPTSSKTFNPTTILQRSPKKEPSTTNAAHGSSSSVYPSETLSQFLNISNPKSKVQPEPEFVQPKLTNEQEDLNKKMAWLWKEMEKARANRVPFDVTELEKKYDLSHVDAEENPEANGSLGSAAAPRPAVKVHSPKKPNANANLPKSAKQQNNPRQNPSTSVQSPRTNNTQSLLKGVPGLVPIPSQVFYRTPVGLGHGSAPAPRHPPPLAMFPVPLMNVGKPRPPAPGIYDRQTQGLMQILGMPNSPPRYQSTPNRPVFNNQNHPSINNAQPSPDNYQPGLPNIVPRSKGRGRGRRENLQGPSPFVPLQVDRASAGRPAAARGPPQVIPPAASVSPSKAPPPPPHSTLLTGITNVTAVMAAPPANNEERPKKSRIAANFGPAN